MSTTAESAQKWITDKAPSNEEIQAVLTKLEQRIEAWEGEDDAIQGSIEAAVYLQSVLDQSEKAVNDAALPELPSDLNSSSLIPEAKPIELEEDVKQATFAALKNQLGKAFNK